MTTKEKEGQNLKKRINEIIRIVNNKPGDIFLGAYDKAFDKLFKSAFQGDTDSKAWKDKLAGTWKSLYRHESNHDNHFHVRLGRYGATKIDKAVKNLKKNKCTWKKPAKYSDGIWKKYASQYSNQGKLPPSKTGYKPKKKKT